VSSSFVEIIKPGTHIDFIGRWPVAVAVSLAVLLAGLVGLVTRGMRMGIDFAGGTEVQVRFESAQTGEGAIRKVLQGLDIPSPSVIRYGKEGSGEFLIKFQGERAISRTVTSEGTAKAGKGSEKPGQGGAITAKNDRIMALEAALDREIGSVEVERVEFVGPKVGAELRENGLRSIGIACLLILVYIAFRFSARFAPGAVVALIHDVLITSGIWILLGLDFDLRVLAALLAIIGYSLNDTIIVYDRIRENMEMRTKYDLKDVLNQSVNQTLSRTLLTSLTTVLAVAALLVIGGPVVRPFALAMAIGIVVGTYSSIYIASPTLLWLESRFGK